MKTKQEIEQLAESEYREYPNDPLDEPAWHYNKDIHCNKKRKAFIKGYTKCQEDNMDKKYTEDNMIWAIQEAYGHGRDEADDILWHQVEESIRVILKSLNKKD
jgi:hypothetical protein